jgi:hypothetical protein
MLMRDGTLPANPSPEQKFIAVAAHAKQKEQPKAS